MTPCTTQALDLSGLKREGGREGGRGFGELDFKKLKDKSHL